MYYSFGMKIDGIKKQISGCVNFKQDDSPWIGLAEALEYLEWLEYQSMLWGYDRVPTNSPRRDRLN